MTDLLTTQLPWAGGLIAVGMNELEEFFAGLQLVPKDSQHGTGDRYCILFFYAAHHHAQMASFHDDGHAMRLELGLQRFRNLDGQPLLHLQPAAKGVHQSRNLAQSDDFLVRHVANVASSEEWEQVMFAHT